MLCQCQIRIFIHPNLFNGITQGAKKALAILSEMERRYSNANIISNKEMYDEDTDTTYHVEDRDGMCSSSIFLGRLIHDTH